MPNLPGEVEDDFWVWDPFLGGHPAFGDRKYTFDLDGLVPVSGASGITVEIISASVAQHSFSVTLNGHLLGTTNWSGPVRQALHFDIDSAWLQAATNSLRITSVGDRLSLAYLDRFTVGYPRRLQPDRGPILFSAPDDSVLEASGPAGTTVEVWEVTDPLQPVRLVRSATAVDPSLLRFQGTSGKNYVTFLRGAVDPTDPLRPFGPDTLQGSQAGAEYLIIAPDSLVGPAGILADRRSRQGLSTRVVSISRIQHEFGYGLSTPTALAGFFRYASTYWNTPPKYEVLVGDGSYDYQNFSGNTDNLIPPLLAGNEFGRAVSDVLFGDLNRDGHSDIAIGRLPVHSAGELNRILGQMADFESRTVTAPTALMLADQPDEGGEFIANARAVQGLLTKSFSVNTIFNDNLDTQAVHDQLLQALSGGVNVFNYIGHGGRDRFGSGYLTETDVGLLDFGPQQPVVVAMTCAAGEFGLPGSPCLGEALLLMTNRAPVAVWSPSGYSVDFQAHQLNLVLSDQLSRQPVGTRLGDTLRQVVSLYRDQGGDAVSPEIYNLLGDPALPLNFGTPRPSLTAQNTADGIHLNLSGTPKSTYRLEATDPLTPPDWQLQGEVVTDATGGARFAQALSPGLVQRYFRATFAR